MRWLSLAVILCVALAGCGQKKAAPAGIPVDEEGDPLPSLEGFVVDEAIRPMEGVVVRILFSDVNATTDDEGHYAIVRPTFLAEDVLLSAAAPGYQARTQQVQLSGQRSTRMDFRLELDRYQMPHTEVLDHRGTLGCQVRTSLPGAPFAYACDPPQPSMSHGVKFPATHADWSIDTTMGLAGAVVQVVWQAETPLTEQLHVVLRGPVLGCCENGEGGSMGEVIANVTGPSPMRLELPEDLARTYPSWSALRLEVRAPSGADGVPASLSRDQSFDAYATLFYVDAAPPGYQLS